MFQPETEDMLPRAAPKPCAPSAEDVTQPTVPEVSILFGQQNSNGVPATTTVQKPQQQSYASWKKQVLPKVTFPPNVVTEIIENTQNNTHNVENIAPRTNMYPLRAAAPLPATIINSAATCVSNVVPTTNAMQYRRSLENSTPAMYTSIPYFLPNPMYQQLQAQQRSLEAMPRPTATIATSDVLTICAGTQTEATLSPTSKDSYENLATKSDFEQLLTMMQQMREEQLRLNQLCEALLYQQKPPKSFCKDASTQCELVKQANVPPAAPIENKVAAQTNDTRPQAPLNNNNYYNATQQAPQTPRATPIAQSTAYRANTPLANRAATLPKPSTEKSMVMNELALKYLPNEKLTELLHEMHVTSPTAPQPQTPTTPLRQIENFDKGPSDISNASYKYLKKYRLLPEENVGVVYQQEQKPCYAHANPQQSPLTTRRQQLQSPCHHVAVSPLATTPMLDLEHIRNQPKFL